MEKPERILLAVCALLILLPLRLYAQGEQQPFEKILYLISPIGQAEYADMGLADLGGKKARLITFKTQVLWFGDTEKIYADPDTLLPIKIERDVSTWFDKEFIIEEYDQNNFILTITKFKENKRVGEQVIKGKGPIQNAILLTFYPRLQRRLDIGWNFKIRIPHEFKVELVSLDKVDVPYGKFKAYHFVSNPDKFELWVSDDERRIPVKIKGKGGLGYALVMKDYSSKTGRNTQ